MEMTAAMKAPWIDDRMRDAGGGVWRKIHLDYNNGPEVSNVAGDWDPEQFAATLKAARVDAIVVFAKDFHGYCYYPSELGPVQPNLAVPDLIGEQVKACRDAGIRIRIYYSLSWDEGLAEEHADWLVVKRDRSTYMPAFDDRPFWTAMCITEPGLLEIVERHTTEILSAYEVDGIWYDMASPIAGECYCWRCLRDLRAAGLDPFDARVQLQHKHELFNDLQKRLIKHVRSVRPEARTEFNTQAVVGLGERAEYVENIDIEVLPTGGWGYDYLPIHARYARTHGVSVFGQTGKFAKSWGDYGGLKHPAQLRIELAGILALGIGCAIGDEAPPGMRLDAAVYETVGELYSEVERVQPYLEGAAAVTEAAIVVGGSPLTHLTRLRSSFPSELGDSVTGLARLLIEQHVQFDVVETAADFERYRLVLVPDELEVDAALAERLKAYMRDGGAVIASHRSLRVDGGEELWPEELRDALRGASPYELPYVRVAGELLGSQTRYRDYDFALYEGADRWLVDEGSGAVVHARLTEPEFEHTPTRAQHPPAAKPTDYAAVVEVGRLGAAAFPLGASFHRHGYWVYRELFARLLERLLPERLVRTSAPLSSEVTLTHQRAGEGRGERWMVHIVNHSQSRIFDVAAEPARTVGGRDRQRVSYMDDPIPLRDTRVMLTVPSRIARAYDAASGAELELQQDGDGWSATVPETVTGSIVVFEAPA